MITSIQAENFKCFSDTTPLDLAPITILVGENNSGKSSLMQILHLPALTLQGEDPAVCLKLLHRDYDYGSYADIAYNHDENLKITLSYGTISSISGTGKGGAAKSLDENAILHLTYGYLPNRRQIFLDRFSVEYGDDGYEFVVSQTDYSKYRDRVGKVLVTGVDVSDFSYLRRLLIRRGCFYYPKYGTYRLYEKMGQHFADSDANQLFWRLYNAGEVIDSFSKSFRSVHHLGPLRIYPRRTYQYSGEVAERVGLRGETALQNYSALLNRRKKEDLEKIDLINNSLYRLGFISSFEDTKIGPRHYEYWARHRSSLLRANLADTGFGTSQVLPVLIALFTSDPGSTLLFEQPEIHLHPSAQAELGSIFVEACSKDRRIMVETHSENMILRIQTEIARGRVEADDVRFYYIQPVINGHKVIPIHLNGSGEFLTEWPKGFFEENYQESLKLFEARQSRG